MEDRLLLQRFVRDNSQEAFAALTARYVSLVYAVCRREMGDADAAEDVTQAVFLILARKAPSLGRNVVLSGWLFQTARFAAKNARLRELRRKHYEEKAMERHPQAATGEAHWNEIEPLLNKSLARLKAADRDCLLLRFFQDMTFAEVGTCLGLSEEAARKRVTRALEKLRYFFGKEEVYLPSVALAGLLTAHAAQTVPATCQAAVTQVSIHAVAGHASAALTGSHAYQLTEGVMKAMKIAKLKMLTGSLAVVVVGSAVSYGMLHGQAPDQKTAYRTVILIGKARYEDGQPAGGVHIGAQLQNNAEGPLLQSETQAGVLTERLKQIMWNETVTHADGTYKLAVGADVAYNIEVFPGASSENLDGNGWVAAAAEGVSGHKNQQVIVPELLLSQGMFVKGTVTDKISGKPVSGMAIGSFGPERPETSAAPAWAHADSAGRYQLRVLPGKHLIYIGDVRYNGLPDNEAEAKGVAKIVTVTAGQSATADFQVTPK